MAVELDLAVEDGAAAVLDDRGDPLAGAGVGARDAGRRDDRHRHRPAHAVARERLALDGRPGPSFGPAFGTCTSRSSSPVRPARSVDDDAQRLLARLGGERLDQARERRARVAAHLAGAEEEVDARDALGRATGSTVTVCPSRGIWLTFDGIWTVGGCGVPPSSQMTFERGGAGRRLAERVLGRRGHLVVAAGRALRQRERRRVRRRSSLPMSVAPSKNVTWRMPKSSLGTAVTSTVSPGKYSAARRSR